ncbi:MULTISPECIES: cupin domain-containing protein [unclassified Bradyrhizobium]|uniref:cupin domain-containing protein n=1 Tax=unclassified Bradyrhizobium TaxID=2631580 RepID=UPI001FF8B5AE|nr:MULTISPECIES: cupin domain-containing protein [unclassified Bradyrhizobium]
MLSRLLASAFVLAGVNTAIADDMKMPINSGELKWEAAPPTLPKGADIAVLSGDPSKEGLFVLRLRMPSGYKIPAHNHPTDEGATVISGNFSHRNGRQTR